MADHRDKYRPKTPPPGVRAQTATGFDTKRRIAQLHAELIELGGGVPEEIPHEDTPVYIKEASPEVHRAYRENKPSGERRFVAEKIGMLESDVRHIDEKLELLRDSELARKNQREDLELAAKLDRERAQIERDAADAKAARELKVTSGAFRAKIILAIIAGLVSLGGAYFVGKANAPDPAPTQRSTPEPP